MSGDKYMSEQIQFLCFRGNMSFPDQRSIFNLGLKDDSESKNKMFCFFFEELKKDSKIESVYQKREYYFIYINQYGNIMHCQLARKRLYNKFEMKENDRIINTKDEDFPYVNVFVELKSQKFLIQSNTQVFENYNTCRDVIQNIMNNFYRDSYKDVVIEINPILKEEEFWSFFGENKKIYNLHFSLCTPNLFGAETAATDFLDDVKENTGANHADITFSNSDGNIIPNRKGINSFVEYVSAGGGTWHITYSESDGKKMKVSSTQKSYKINIPMTIEELNNNLDKQKLDSIIEALSIIESVERFKE